jgi:hypothetical protein
MSAAISPSVKQEAIPLSDTSSQAPPASPCLLLPDRVSTDTLAVTRSLFCNLAPSRNHHPHPPPFPSTHSTATMAEDSEQEYFRFLDLPVELRVLVYQQLSPSNKHVRISNAPNSNRDDAVLVLRSEPTPILRTCKTIYTEAHSIIREALRHVQARPLVQIVLPMDIGETEIMVVLFLRAIHTRYGQLCANGGFFDEEHKSIFSRALQAPY